MTLAAIRAALAHPNVAAFLRLIRERESGQENGAYTVINGGSHFTVPPWAHPWPDGTPTTKGGRAAGAYQFLPSTWKRVAEQLGLPDFSPENQDLGAVYLIAGRKALDDVLAGNINLAIQKCRPEWTSLPGAAESSASWTLEKARACYERWGGTFAPVEAEQDAAPIEDRSRPFNPEQEAPMLPALIPALLPAIIQAIPALIGVFGKGEQSKKNAAAAQIVADTVVKATESVNLQEAVEKMATDETAKAAAQAAVLSQPAIAMLLEVGGGIEAARKANVIDPAVSWWRPLAAPAFIVSLVLLGIVVYVIASILGDAATWRPEDRSQILMLIVAITSGVMGYYLGSSLGSSKKDDALANR